MKFSKLDIGKVVTLGIVLISYSWPVLANTKQLYVALGLGYALNKVNTQTDEFLVDGKELSKKGKYGVEESSYKVNVGYVLSNQWAVEASFIMLGDNNKDNDELIVAKSDEHSRQYNIQALQISALGKASNRHGELYYRIGVMQIKPETNYLSTNMQCGAGDRLLTLPTQLDVLSLCQHNDKLYAGVLGLGFDFYAYPSILLRLEAEYMQGEYNYRAKAIYISLRYNF